MNIINELKDHHEEIRDLFKKTNKDLNNFDELKKSLQIHHINEEKFLLNSAKEKNEVKNESLESIEEHHSIVLMLEDLDNFPKDHERWRIKLGVLEEYIEHHFKEEEEDLFPEACREMSEDKLQMLGREYNRVKNEQLKVL